MAIESVNPVLLAITDYQETDKNEAAEKALRGALALSAIIAEATTGDNECRWADHVIDDLHGLQEIALNVARSTLEELRHENWQLHAKLGDYGQDAKARAEAEVQS